MPSTDRGANVSVGGGVSGFWFFCDGQQIQPLSGGQLPQDASCYSVFSMSYGGGYGFWVLRGDATNPTAGETWRPLCFEHDAQNFSSYVTNAGSNQTLRCQRPDQRWPRMLLPDIYQTTPYPISSAYGGLKGDLAIFLALIAFSMDQNNLRQYLRSMFINGEWIVHGLQHGSMCMMVVHEMVTNSSRNQSARSRRLCIHMPIVRRKPPGVATLRRWRLWKLLQLMDLVERTRLTLSPLPRLGTVRRPYREHVPRLRHLPMPYASSTTFSLTFLGCCLSRKVTANAAPGQTSSPFSADPSITCSCLRYYNSVKCHLLYVTLRLMTALRLLHFNTVSFQYLFQTELSMFCELRLTRYLRLRLQLVLVFWSSRLYAA